MKNSAAGFSLIEIMVVICIFGILVAIGTLETRSWLEKAAIENQAMTLYGELMGVRQSAMNYKQPRSVVVKRDSFQVYSSAETSVTPVANNRLKYPLLQGAGLVAAAGRTVTFDERGFAGTTAVSFCVEPSGDTLNINSGAYDSVVISGLRIRVGKRTVEGAECKGEEIQLK